MVKAVFPIRRGLSGFFCKRPPDVVGDKESLTSTPSFLTAATAGVWRELNRQRRQLLDEVAAGRRLPLPENDEDA